MKTKRSEGLEAMLMCCQVGCGSKQPIYDYVAHLEKIREAVLAKNFKRAKELSDEI